MTAKTMREWTGADLLKQPLPFRPTYISQTDRRGLPVYYAQVYAGYGQGITFPARPIWQSKINQAMPPTMWPSEAHRVAEEVCAKLLARREAADRRAHGRIEE